MDILLHSANVDIRKMCHDDIPLICKEDHDESPRNIAYLTNQLANQEKQECSALIAFYDGSVAGYVFLYYRCRWGALGNRNIPAVVDLVVFDKYRRKGIATLLMDVAEEIARKYCDKIYLEVCLNSSYGAAQAMSRSVSGLYG